MKKCPFCAEEIQDEAVKCRFCGEFLDDSYKPKPKPKWYYTNTAVVVALLCLGPFALPLVWKNPNYKPLTKIIITVLLIAFTIWLCDLMAQAYSSLMKQIQQLGIR